MLEEILELIRLASADLPRDVEQALFKAVETEEPGSVAELSLKQILENVTLAREKSLPLCQDTGSLHFYLHLPYAQDPRPLQQAVREAVKLAVKNYYLRPNAVDPLYGHNSEDEESDGHPSFYINHWDNEETRIDLLLKGGGCENVSAQFSLPYAQLKAERNMEGVFRCVMEAVVKAQGQGCPPGILGVGVGGDRAGSLLLAKKQLMRPLTDKNPEPLLAEFEERLLSQINQLGIGPLGLGGKTTILGVKMAHLHRLPASYFVSVSYMCWACRRRSLTIREGNYYYA
ncbi:MAG: fumarate hydratase [Candidatus Schekmanbacteria bacterium]|nr:fumarate hydratase [Candidatus Schekmanbacteria bacterium]